MWRRLLIGGWGVALLVAVLMVVFRGRDELAPAVVFAAVAVGMGGWVLLRGTRASVIVSLVLGAVWLLQFVAYTIADATSDDDVGAGVFAADVIAVIGGILIVVGAVQGLAALRRERRAESAADAPA